MIVQSIYILYPLYLLWDTLLDVCHIILAVYGKKVHEVLLLGYKMFLYIKKKLIPEKVCSTKCQGNSKLRNMVFSLTTCWVNS